MARKFSTYSRTVKDLTVHLRFEAEELNAQGLVLDDSFHLTMQEYFNTLDIAADTTLENTAQEIHSQIMLQLMQDPGNVYTNLMGDEYPRVKLIYVDVQGSYTATCGD